jgi:hypothetical protein
VIKTSEPLRSEEPRDFAELRDVDLQRVLCGRREVLSPQIVDQTVARDDLVGVQEQDCQQRSLLRPSEGRLTPSEATCNGPRIRYSIRRSGGPRP